MRKATMTLIAAAALAAQSCRPGQSAPADIAAGDAAAAIHTPPADSAIYGTCGMNSAMNTIEISRSDGSATAISIHDAKERGSVIGGYDVGDSLTATIDAATGEASKTVNISSLCGTWIQLATSGGTKPEPFEIGRNGKITHGTKAIRGGYDSWHMDNCRLVMQGATNEGTPAGISDTFDIRLIDGRTMLLERNGGTSEYARLK